MASLLLSKNNVKLLLKAIEHACQPTKRGKEIMPHLGGVGEEGHDALHILAHHFTKLGKVLHIGGFESIAYTNQLHEREGSNSRLCALVTMSISDSRKKIKIALKVVEIQFFFICTRREDDAIAIIGRNIMVEHGVKAIHQEFAVNVAFNSALAVGINVR